MAEAAPNLKADLSEAEQNPTHWTKDVECQRFRLAAVELLKYVMYLAQVLAICFV